MKDQYFTGTSRAELGEGLIYVKQHNSLYWVDILGNKIYQHNLKTNSFSEWRLPIEVSHPSAILPTTAPNKFIIPVKNYLICWDSSTNKFEYLHDKSEINDKPLIPTTLRFNDAKLDPTGEIMVGTMDLFNRPRRAALHRFNKNNSSLDTLLSDVSLSNGFDWSYNREFFYYIDTLERKLSVYKWNLATNSLIEPALSHVELYLELGVPDGLITGPNGTVYVSMWDGSRILVIKPFDYDDPIKQRIDLPFSRPTTCALIDDKLYIVSAHVENEESSGFLYWLNTASNNAVTPKEAILYDIATFPPKKMIKPPPTPPPELKEFFNLLNEFDSKQSS